MDNWPAPRSTEEKIIRKVMTLATWPDIARSIRIEVFLICSDPDLTAQEVRSRLRRALMDDRELSALYRSVERDERNLGGIPIPPGPPRGLLKWVCKDPQCPVKHMGDRDGPYGPIRCATHGLLVLAP